MLLVVAFNYAAIVIPLVKKEASIRSKANAILIRQVKSGDMFKNSDEEYVLELFRKERSAIAKKILILNCVSISLAMLIASWTVFGLVIHGKK